MSIFLPNPPMIDGTRRKVIGRRGATQYSDTVSDRELAAVLSYRSPLERYGYVQNYRPVGCRVTRGEEGGGRVLRGRGHDANPSESTFRWRGRTTNNPSLKAGGLPPSAESPPLPESPSLTLTVVAPRQLFSACMICRTNQAHIFSCTDNRCDTGGRGTQEKPIVRPHPASFVTMRRQN